MAPFMQSAIGCNLYEWLTAVVMGTQRGMSRKWCYWFREHEVLCRRYGRINLLDKRIWLFEPGWSLAPVLMATIATGNGQTVTEDHRRLARRYVPIAIGEVEKSVPRLCPAGHRSQTAVELLGKVRRDGTPQSVLKLCGAQYLELNLQELQTMSDASQDICMSMGRLEHFTADQLEALFKQMSRILTAGGIGSHIVDHRDHFWHYDKSIHCFNHLTYSEKQWSSIAKGQRYTETSLSRRTMWRCLRFMRQSTGIFVITTDLSGAKTVLRRR